MKVDPFPSTSQYQRKRTPRKRRSVSSSKISPFSSGIDANFKRYLGYITQPHENDDRAFVVIVGGYEAEKHRLPFKFSRHVYQKVKLLLVPKGGDPFNPNPSSLRFPRAPTLKAKVAAKQIMMSTHVTGVISAQVEPKECQCPANSTSHPRARRRGRKRKLVPKDELSDSEVTVPRYIHLRGQARRRQSSNNISAIEEGNLDSATFLHYFMHIWSAFPEEKVNSFIYFDPLWFNLYANENSRPKVLNWIKEKAIFSKKYVLVPIVLWSHWSLLIFCHLGESLQSKTNTPCMLLLDSLHAIGPTRLESMIRRLLLDLYNMEERLEKKEQLKKVPLLIPKIPQQKKGEECGFYVLYYINLFLGSAPENFNVSKGYPYFMTKDWFTVEEIDSFYKKLDSFTPSSCDQDDSASMDSSSCFELIETSSERFSS